MVAGVNCHHFLSYPCVKFDSFFRLEGIKNGQKQPPLAHVVSTHPSPKLLKQTLAKTKLDTAITKLPPKAQAAMAG